MDQQRSSSSSVESVEHGISPQRIKRASCSAVLTLAYQSLGVVYGDLSTSPLYVYKTTFSEKLSLREDDEEIYGVLSFIFWTFTLVALFKYIFVVMSADDNGEGGTFALYSLLCRHAKLGILPNQEPKDEKLSSYAVEGEEDTTPTHALKHLFEKYERFHKWLLIFVLLGTCMAIGDGILTPAISVLSAVSGVRLKLKGLHENYVVVVSCIILIVIFSLQHHGTHRVAFMFAPIVTAWLFCISSIGVYNIARWNPSIVYALSPVYMFKLLKNTGMAGWMSLGGVVLSITGVETMFADLGHFSASSIKYLTHRVAFMFAPIVTAWLFCISSIGVYNIARWNPSIVYALSPVYMFKLLKNTGMAGWMSLGGVVLSITGVETMFADLGHFSASSIKLAFTCLVYPCLVLAYMGEAAFLSQHHEDIQQSFYKAIPEPVFWPVFIVATFAAVVGSQAVITATFSIISQCCALNCFPRVKIVHTSSEIYGQIYIPEVNWILMCLCLAVTIGLRDTNMLGHAYGLAVTTVMFVTTCLMVMVMIIVWRKRIITAVAFLLFFGSIELLYISACLFKVPESGWIPLALSSILMLIMYVWNYGTLKKHEFDMENKVSMDRIVSLGPSIGMVRVAGIGLLYTNLATGVPAVFGHFVTNLPAFHQILVLVCVKSIHIPHVREEERFLIARIGPKEHGMFRCIVRYGYKDLQQENYDFENKLVSELIRFVETEEPLAREAITDGVETSKDIVDYQEYEAVDPSVPMNLVDVDLTNLPSSYLKNESIKILRARESGVAYIFGHSYAKAKKSSAIFKKVAINFLYAFLSKNCRGPDVVLNVPHTSLLEVGMVYYV